MFGLEPSFDVPIINVTVEEGATAVLPCSVDFLGDHKVSTVTLAGFYVYLSGLLH